MKSIFHGREVLVRLPLFAALGLAIFGMVFTYLSADGHEIGSPHTSLSEQIELDPKAPFVYKTYTGPQNVQELMKALDADYTKSLAKTRVSVSGKFTAKTTKTGKVTDSKATTYSSDLTLSEIDARYPRAEWLQLLLDKGITIDDSLEYASLLSKRYTLALWEDNPVLQQSALLDIPPTDDWETYKAAYIDKLVNDHTKIQEAAEKIERGQKAVERAKARIEQSKEHTKLAIERGTVHLERAMTQLERSTVHLECAKPQIERAMTQLEHSIARLKRAQKALSSQQLVHIKKQIESAQEILEPPKPAKEPTPPQEPIPPQGSN